MHQAFEVLELIIEFFLNVVLHLVRDESARYLFTDLRNYSEVVCREVLIAFLVGDFKTADCMVAELDRDEKDISDDLVQALVDL